MTRSDVRARGGRTSQLSSLFAALLLAGGCAAGPGFPAGPGPERIPALEAAVEAGPANPETLWQLGAAFRAAGELDAALTALTTASEMSGAPAEAWLFLGFTHEDLEQPEQAIAAYRSYQAMGGPGAEALDGRIRLMELAAVRAAALRAIEQEEIMTQQEPAPNSIAIFPFEFATDAEELAPLSRALAEMLITDLSVTDRLTVVERIRVQALLDELRLSLSGLGDPDTAIRSGYLVGAARVVQGRISGAMEALQLDASVVAVADPSATPPVSSVSDEASRILDMQKTLAFEIYDDLGIELTAAERERVSERPTENLQAILAFGRGLEASDNGDFRAAAGFFRQAAEIDPGFSQAESEAAEAEGVSEAAEVDTGQLGVTVTVEALDVGNLGLSDLSQRDPAAEITGTEQVGASTILEIIIRGRGGDR